MTFADEAEFTAFAYRDHLLPHFTAEAVQKALKDFPLHMQCTLDWLALAGRRALAATIPNVTDSPNRVSDSTIRKDLRRLATDIDSAFRRLDGRSPEADTRIWNFAFDNWGGLNGQAISEAASFAYNRFKQAIDEVAWLSQYLSEVSESTPVSETKWRMSELKRLRIERCYFLAPVFEVAFKEPVSANNFPSDARHPNPTPFMLFYEKMSDLAFSDVAATNISDVTKTALALHREHPVQFNEEMIPGINLVGR